jgi:hypothetical protein
MSRPLAVGQAIIVCGLPRFGRQSRTTKDDRLRHARRTAKSWVVGNLVVTYGGIIHLDVEILAYFNAYAWPAADPLVGLHLT